MKEEKPALLVIDMQADYIGETSKNKYYPYDLIEKINEKISFFQKQKNPVIYVKNIGRRKKEPYICDFVYGLSIISDNIVVKDRASIFSSAKLLNLFNQKHISQLEIVGIDGNGCVAKSAIDASKFGYSVIMPINCVGIKDKERFTDTRKKLAEANVIVIE